MSRKKEEQGARTADWSGLDDDILIKAFLNGDQTAFEVLFRKYRDMVGRLSYSIVKEESAVDDIVQETFLLAYRHLENFRGQAAFKTWIYRIAVNEAIRHKNKGKRWQPLPENESEYSQLPSTLVAMEGGNNPERILIDGQQKTLVHRALAQLKEHHRLILVLYYLEDQSVHEISVILEIPEGSVKSRLYYAREGLKQVLGPILYGKGQQTSENAHAL
ncbi:MAG: sigma-70 family RNA polymerase sigma factor [SAR324 cluster bacterium]|nr:sigma-70 family RNA polymerase sigma factor [SAR324 cluster bacterium]